MTIAKPKTKSSQALSSKTIIWTTTNFFVKIKRSLNVLLSLSSSVFSNSVDMMSQNNEALLDP